MGRFRPGYLLVYDFLTILSFYDLHLFQRTSKISPWFNIDFNGQQRINIYFLLRPSNRDLDHYSFGHFQANPFNGWSPKLYCRGFHSEKGLFFLRHLGLSLPKIAKSTSRFGRPFWGKVKLTGAKFLGSLQNLDLATITYGRHFKGKLWGSRCRPFITDSGQFISGDTFHKGGSPLK